MLLLHFLPLCCLGMYQEGNPAELLHGGLSYPTLVLFSVLGKLSVLTDSAQLQSISSVNNVDPSLLLVPIA